MIGGLKHVTQARVSRTGLSFAQDFIEPGSAHWTVILRVPGPLRRGRRTVRSVKLGTLGTFIVHPGKHRIQLRFTRAGRLALKQHPRAAIALDTSFTDELGRRFATATTLRK